MHHEQRCHLVECQVSLVHAVGLDRIKLGLGSLQMTAHVFNEPITSILAVDEKGFTRDRRGGLLRPVSPIFFNTLNTRPPDPEFFGELQRYCRVMKALSMLASRSRDGAEDGSHFGPL